ncbi:uncharacterized protein LOC144155408 [Haemaphysalis longicornis]
MDQPPWNRDLRAAPRVLAAALLHSPKADPFRGGRSFAEPSRTRPFCKLGHHAAGRCMRPAPLFALGAWTREDACPSGPSLGLTRRPRSPGDPDGPPAAELARAGPPGSRRRPN